MKRTLERAQRLLAWMLTSHIWSTVAVWIILYFIFHALFVEYAEATVGKWDEFWSTYEHVTFTLAVILTFRGLEYTIDFRETSESYLGEVRKMLEFQRNELRDAVLPLSSHWGLAGAKQGIDFLQIFKEAQPGSNIQIFFTFHPSLSDDLGKLVDIINEKNIHLRLLIGSPDSQSVKRRFRYIGWMGSDGKDLAYIDRLRNFVQVEIPNARKQYRKFEIREMLRVKTFQYLPDIPIIIESRPAAGSPGQEGKRGDRLPQVVERVFTGFYMLQPAVQGLLLEWQSVHVDSLAQAFLEYFEARWSADDTIVA